MYITLKNETATYYFDRDKAFVVMLGTFSQGFDERAYGSSEMNDTLFEPCHLKQRSSR